jgi:hypothetical protein
VSPLRGGINKDWPPAPAVFSGGQAAAPPRVFTPEQSGLDAGILVFVEPDGSRDATPGLEYESRLTPRPAPSQWKYYLLGPFAGAGVGAINTVSAVWSWEHFGRPNFYFRSYAQVDFHLAVMIIGGAVAGCAFGAVWDLVERWSRRRVDTVRLIAVMWAIAVIVFGVVHYYEIRNRVMLPVFVCEAVVFVLCLGAGGLLFRRMPGG